MIAFKIQEVSETKGHNVILQSTQVILLLAVQRVVDTTQSLVRIWFAQCSFSQGREDDVMRVTNNDFNS